MENGRARATIVVPDANHAGAAEDLRDYIAKATGARLGIVEERTLAAGQTGKGARMRFFVEQGMRLTDYASCFGNWGTHGLNYYVLARLLRDPGQPMDPIIDDYCRAANGTGAKAVTTGGRKRWRTELRPRRRRPPKTTRSPTFSRTKR